MTTATSNDHTFTAVSPATGEVVWEGSATSPEAVRRAVAKARAADEAWCLTSPDEREAVALRFKAAAVEREDELTAAISRETGKPLWEARSEAKLVPAKVDLAIRALQERTGNAHIDLPQGSGVLRYQPVGVMAVLGPFNFPAHLPNGQIVPALLAGNAVVFKPSEYTPGTGELLAACWQDAGLPEGVLQVVQGARETGAALVEADVDGVLFTGSHAGGRAIHRALAGRPEVLLALEMGGNNPIVVHDAADLDAAATLVAVSAFISAGQRCTCARRLIVIDGPEAEALLERITKAADALIVGLPDEDPAPFMGPVISAAAGQRVLDAQADLITRGGVALRSVETQRGNPALLSPGIVDVTAVADRRDEEVFGPLLQVVRVTDLDAAFDEVNRTAFGLAAALLSDRVEHYETFKRRVRAGVINWNQPTTGASGRLPFGGLGASGNHRPAGYHAADFCAAATAAVESPELSLPSALLPGLNFPLTPDQS
ncbi:MAG: succinylglutamate-semialdehyde dehydrogenase [Planctomycetota bacterium]